MNFRIGLLIAATIVFVVGLGVRFFGNRSMKRACGDWADLIHESWQGGSIEEFKHRNAELFKLIMEQLSDLDDGEARAVLSKVTPRQSSELLRELERFKFAKRNVDG
jgi:hypothetical protein